MSIIRATSRRERKETRYAEIIDAAFLEFSSNGFTATRLDDVAARVGVTKGSLYLYFDSKEQLFSAVLRHQITQFLVDDDTGLLAEEGSWMVGADETAVAALRRVLRSFYKRYAYNLRARELLRLIIAEGGKFPDLIEFYHTEVLGRCIAGLRRLLDNGVGKGEFRDVAAEPFVLIGFAPVLEAAVWGLVFADRYPFDLEAHFEMHCNLLLNGLVA